MVAKGKYIGNILDVTKYLRIINLKGGADDLQHFGFNVPQTLDSKQ